LRSKTALNDIVRDHDFLVFFHFCPVLAWLIADYYSLTQQAMPCRSLSLQCMHRRSGSETLGKARESPPFDNNAHAIRRTLRPWRAYLTANYWKEASTWAGLEHVKEKKGICSRLGWAVCGVQGEAHLARMGQPQG
jgi:hypothetical protein